MLSPQEDISKLSTNFTNQLMKICEKITPKSKSGPKKKLRPPWWNQTCTNAIRTREKARKKYLDHKTQENKDKYNQLRINARKTLKISQKECWESFISKLTHKSTSKEVWAMVHKFRGKPPVPITCLDLNDQIITDDSQKAETLAHYDNMSKSTNLDPTFQAAKTAQETFFKKCLPNIKNERNNLNSQFTLFELNHALILNTTQHQGRTQFLMKCLNSYQTHQKRIY